MHQLDKLIRPSVSVVGAGRLGTALALALETAGYRIEALVAKHLAKAVHAAKTLDRQPLALTAAQLSRLPASDIIIIATPDDQIPTVAANLGKPNRLTGNRQVYLHTSGALSSKALESLSVKGKAVGSLHPLIAVAETKAGAESLRGAFWCVEGDRLAVEAARRIVRDLDGEGFSIRADKKALYHAAAVMVSGHVAALFDLAIGMLIKSGLTRKRAREVLLPLIESNVRNLAVAEPEQALTGSFARGDAATIKRHLRTLAMNKEKDALAAYRILGERSLQLAAANKLDKRAVKEIRKLLAQDES